ncbi:hypothetical protein I5677_07455 [Mobilitalea sibirica]|uniref:Peptidase C39-like protein n=1 Tax=Mobilitalea sibirica TaxID=1462919 RepID=A0A8J7KVY7_9FIRM|nr:hypothetical protein [Mobilitalea sibirica]MBH1940720.1 hypothetical protein [Mobilitalea sibirica]
MLKHIYRIIILIGIFIASILYFSRDIKEVVFDIDITTVMEETTLPLVTIKVSDNKINLLRAYSTNLNANTIREAVTPLDSEQTFEILINEEEYEIKKLNYELREFVGNDLIETDSISVFNEVDNVKAAKIKLDTRLEPGKEYACKITLITDESKKMYFYHRVKKYENAYVTEKLSFVMDFHNAIKDKDTAQKIIKNLETKKNADNSTLAYVNIHSSFELVTWGNIKPVFLTEIIPTVKEINPETGSVELDYIIEAEIAGVKELFRIKEFYRVRYTKDRMYLLNYERKMESIFDVNLASVSKSQFKLGISSDYEVPYLASADKKKLAFVRNRELWFYNLEVNELVKVFSFRQEDTDYIRDIYDQHDIRILNMDAEGNINFLVYGYMNRGQYEGRVGLLLYQYIRDENRIEEMVYIPIDESYQKLKENIGDLTYMNALDVFYLHLYNNIYSYNTITKQLSLLAENISNENVEFLKNLNHVVWQDNSDPRLSKRIKIMDLETGEIETIDTQSGYNIILMDKINSNLIYGLTAEEDITTLIDGKVIAPLNILEITTLDKKVLKKYSKAGYYITDVEVKDNIIELSRVRKENDNGRLVFPTVPKDYIMNQIKNEPTIIEVTTRVTEQALTEIYLTMPKGFVMNTIPKVSNTIHTVISDDPTVRLPKYENTETVYYPYVFGGIKGLYKESSEAIQIAGKSIGVVLNDRNQLVWERGVKASKSLLSKFDTMNWSASSNQSMENCLRLMLLYQGISVSLEQVNVNNQSAIDVLNMYSKHTPVRLTGITLEDALYFVSEGRPIIAMTNSRDAVLIYGYDAFNIMIIDPKLNKSMKMGIQDSTKLFEEAGNVFISYLRE